MITENYPQLSQQWFDAHRGIPSASNFGKILTPTGKPSAQAEKYMYQLAGEAVAGTKEESYTSAAMQRGIDTEAEARQFYELVQDIEVQKVGACFPIDKSCCCSPDGVMPEIKRGLEIKCPILTTHVEYLLAGKLPTIYIPQVQGSMMITGYESWHFLAYYPGLKPLLLLIERDEKYIKTLKLEIYKFNLDLRKVIEKIR